MSEKATIELAPREEPKFLRDVDPEGDSFVSDGQIYLRVKGFDDWLGFYDWLRSSERSILGVRLNVDDPESLALFKPFVERNVWIEGNLVSIRTADGLIDEALSDDADFGGNAVFKGDSGGLAIVFFSAKLR